MEWIFSLDNINRVAKECLGTIKDKSVVAFHGSMGSGKTTFIHALCDVLGVKDAVGSPTFSIINEYGYDIRGIKRKIFHIDLYRLKDEDEALKTGVEDCFYSGNTCLVEWPEKALKLFPPGTVHVYIEMIDDKTRRLKIAKI